MKKQSSIGQGGGLFNIVILLLAPALLAAQTGPKKPPESAQVIDMGTYRVSPPPGGGWKSEFDRDAGAIAFTKVKNSLMNYFTMQRRAILVQVKSNILNIYGWRSTEEEVIDSIVSELVQGAFPPDAKLDRETLEWDGKKIYSIKYLERSGGINSDNVLFLYLPPDYVKSHTFFLFEFAYIRPGTQYIKLFNNPGMAPVRAVIKSLEIVDSLQTIPGAQGDLVRAAASGNPEGVVRAIEAGADINAGDPERGALSAAAFFGRREIVDLLLDKGARIDTADARDGATPLLAAMIGREPEIALHLISKGADVNRKISAGGGADVSPLMFAVAIGHLDLARSLIDAGADLGSRTGLGESALVLAADNGWTEGLALLLERGGDVNARMNNGWTALMRAAAKGRSEIVKLLLDNKADANLKATDGNWNGSTALLLAVNGGYADIVRTLIDYHADLNTQQAGSGDTSLHGAVELGRLEIAKILIQAGADVNLKRNDGQTPLMAASEKGRNDLAKLLIENGADVNAKNNKAQTALGIAKKNKQAYIVGLLQAAGAK